MYIAPPSASAPHPYGAPQHPEEACEWPCEASSSSFVKLGRPPALSCEWPARDEGGWDGARERQRDALGGVMDAIAREDRGRGAGSSRGGGAASAGKSRPGAIALANLSSPGFTG